LTKQSLLLILTEKSTTLISYTYFNYLYFWR